MIWGTVGGKDVHLVTLKSDALEVDVCSYGAALVAVRVKVQGEWIDVIMGYESLDRYLTGGKPNFSTVVGRCANRVAGAKFELDGQSFELDKNNGAHHLHGGAEGFYKQPFEMVGSSDTEVTLTFSEPDGTMGFPGKVDVSVTYKVVGNELHFDYSGVTDKPTILSMTNHGYWNLKGHASGSVLDHLLMVNGSRVTATDSSLAITGELRPVEGTGLDFRGSPRLLQAAVDAAGPVDVSYCLDGEAADGKAETVLAARLVGPNGVTMDVWTDQPGLQVYTGNFIASPEHPSTWWNGKGAVWQRFGAISLEPQLWPDGIHHSHFPSPVLRPGETYKHHAHHVFTVQE